MSRAEYITAFTAVGGEAAGRPLNREQLIGPTSPLRATQGDFSTFSLLQMELANDGSQALLGRGREGRKEGIPSSLGAIVPQQRGLEPGGFGAWEALAAMVEEDRGSTGVGSSGEPSGLRDGQRDQVRQGRNQVNTGVVRTIAGGVSRRQEGPPGVAFLSIPAPPFLPGL